MALHIEIDETENKFFAMVEGQECVLSFRILKDGVWDYYHTFVPPSLRNRGIAGELVVYALRHARKHGHKIIPSCPYVRTYVEEHSEWHDIVV